MSILAAHFMPPPRPSSSTAITMNIDSTSSRRVPRNKDFHNKYGHRHHSFDPEKAPYPLSYDRQVLELESMDHSFVMHVKKSVSVVEFPDGLPKRSLDLGCGGGTWVLDAAKEWPDCEFVGFDLVNVQVPTSFLEPEVANRVAWVHGNFLTTKLPFDDDEFDHVHMHGLGRGIPENKWGVLFEEVNRILRPGGVVEVLEHDIVFPTLPTWFTAPLRARNKRSDSVHYPNGSHHRVDTLPSSSDIAPLPHDHALLESLYYAVFENRFINLRPTAILPIHFTSTFRRVISAPIVHFRMPTLPPLQALPQPLPPNALLLEASFSSDRSDISTPPHAPPTPRPIAVSFSSTHSSATSKSTSSRESSLFSSIDGSAFTQPTSPADFSPCSPALSCCTTDTLSSETPHVVKKPLYIVDSSAAESTSMGVAPSHSLIPLHEIDKLNERSLAMQLYWSYQSVLACQEAMYEELVDRTRNRTGELAAFGWETDQDLSELESRTKFEILVDRYKRDMQARISLWCSLAELGWSVPPREAMSKAELVEEERLYRAMLEARQYASEEDFHTPCRSVRIFVGYKDL
ncbi:S-adenosylmethionine-dependent methyltransferase [Rhizopogon vesiculosus]|uniref:S-adenosylmethionine-dependent methyltransferase n=1 Tax=Rhizopogon vesiculosus TaxID=180088 RepID=A0A1J8QF64_9AGAM|nr:S-adenosylmethionine-dependent methyltransferase [Rhizopogon vesiculosus]